jgi:hypothetical protein
MSVWTEIARVDAPVSGVFDFPTPTLTGYRVLELILSGITVTTDGTVVFIQFYVGGTLITTPYRWDVIMAYANSSNNDADPSASQIDLGSNSGIWLVGNAAGESFSSVVTIDEPLSTTHYKKATYESVLVGTDGNINSQGGSGIMENTGAIDGLKVSGGSALLTGKAILLGLV